MPETAAQLAGAEAGPGSEIRLLPYSTSSLIWPGVAAATAVAVVLRAVFVGDQSLGYEEVFTASIVSHRTLGGVLHAVKATESTPPLFYVLTWLWSTLTGEHSAVALRAVSLVAGSATVPFAFLATRRFVGPPVALAVAWLGAVSPLLLEYSIYARSYALLVLVATLSVGGLGALLERETKRRWLLWAVAVTACLWTHYYTIFLVIAEVAVLLVKLPRARVRLIASAVGVGAAVAPLWPLFQAQSGDSGRTAFIGGLPLGYRLEGIVRQFAMGTNVPHAWLEALGILLAGLGVLLGVVAARRRASMQVLAALAVIGAGVPVGAAVVRLDDHLLARNIVGVWICVAAVVAYGLARWRCVPLLGYTIVCLTAILTVQTDWRYQGSADWDGVSKRMGARVHGDPVAVVPGLDVSVAGLYLHRAPLGMPVSTRDLWVMIEPARGIHQRALNPVAAAPLIRLWSPGFRPAQEVDYRGFRLIRLHSPSPVVVSPAPSPDNGPATAPLALVLGP